MKSATSRVFFSLLVGAMLATASFAQDDQGAKQDMKDAGHSTAQATKKTAHSVKNTTKKGANKTARATKNTAQKAENKTQ